MGVKHLGNAYLDRVCRALDVEWERSHTDYAAKVLRGLRLSKGTDNTAIKFEAEIQFEDEPERREGVMSAAAQAGKNSGVTVRFGRGRQSKSAAILIDGPAIREAETSDLLGALQDVLRIRDAISAYLRTAKRTG